MKRPTKKRLRDESNIILQTPRKSKLVALENIVESIQHNVNFNAIGHDITREILLFVLNNEENTQESTIQLVCREWKNIYDSLLNERLDIFLRNKPYSYLQQLVCLRSLEKGVVDLIFDIDATYDLHFEGGRFEIQEDIWNALEGYYSSKTKYYNESVVFYNYPSKAGWDLYGLQFATLGDFEILQENPLLNEAFELFADFQASNECWVGSDCKLRLPERKIITPALKQIISEINTQYKIF